MQVRVVETFDMAGRHAQAELPLQRRENTVRVAGGVFDLDLLELLEPVQPGVALRQFQKTQLVAPLRHGERDVFPQASRWGERDDYLARELARQPLGDRPDRIGQHVARRVFESRFQLDRERVDDRPVGYAHEVAEGGVLVRDQREHVHVRQRVAHYDRLALVGGQDLDPFLVLRGLLEAHRFGGLAHFLFQVAHRVAGIAAQQRSDHADAMAVILLALQSDARALAVADMVLEADAVTVLGNRLGGQVQRAGAQAVDTVCHVQNGLLDVDRRVRPEILRSVAHEPPGRLHARERLVADHDPRVGLVVLEQDVVARLEALDHVVLEQERLALAGDDRVAQVGDPGDHDPHFRALVRFRREVGVDPPVQVFRLAHVDHLSVGAQKLVDAGRLGQQGDLLLELLDALGWFHGV